KREARIALQSKGRLKALSNNPKPAVYTEVL
uniref:Uncharacterized protein n=1 Tax=Caenorhabditis japonica TaxID=281687 RepID=A0A8R1IJD6_CAEJA